MDGWPQCQTNHRILITNANQIVADFYAIDLICTYRVFYTSITAYIMSTGLLRMQLFVLS